MGSRNRVLGLCKKGSLNATTEDVRPTCFNAANMARLAAIRAEVLFLL